MHGITTFLNWAGESFVDFAAVMLVQSGALIVILLGLDLLIRKRVRAVFRCWMWMLVLVKLMLPTTLSLPTGLGYWFGDKLVKIVTEKPFAAKEEAEPPAIADSEVWTGAAPVTSEGPVTIMSPASEAPPLPITETAVAPTVKAAPLRAAPAVTWKAFVFVGWLAVVTAMALLLIQRMLFVRGLIAQSKDAGGPMVDVFEHCRQQISARGHITFKLSPVAGSPSVCGLFRSVILIPQGLAGKLDLQHLRSILLHELAHIKRGDLWVSFIQTILQIVYIYNPLLWLANAVIRKIREQAVDEMVLAAMGEDAEDYPETLLNVSRLTFSRPALSLRLVGVVESKKALTSRIKHILSRPFPKTAKLGFLGLIAILLTAAVLLPMAKAKTQVEYPKALREILMPEGTAASGDFSWFPDSEKIAARLVQKFGKYDSRSVIAVLELESGKVEILSEPNIKHCNPACSPDGRKIAYIGPMGEYSTIWLMDVNGDNKRPIANVRCWRRPAWSPDSKRLVFTERNNDIWVVNADGSGLRQLTSGRGARSQPQWSPDGTQIAFVDVDEIWLMNADGSNRRVLTEIVSKPGYGPIGDWDDFYDWSPDGKQIVCAYRPIPPEGKHVTHDGGIHPYQIWIVNVDGTDKHCLTPEDISCGHPIWTPDNRHILFESVYKWVVTARLTGVSYPKRNIWILDLVQNKKRQLTTAEYIRQFALSPDGTKVVFLTLADERLFLMEDILSPTGQNIDTDRDAPIEVLPVSPRREFSASLPNGVTVELLGVCEYPSKGKQWWRPDGTLFILPAGITIEDRLDGVGDNAYQFLFGYNSEEDLAWASLDAVCLHFSIEGHSGTNLINFRRLPKGGQDALVAKVAIFEKPLDSTTIKANLATGNWQTKAIRDISKIDQRNDDLWWFTSQSAGHTMLDILHRVEGQQIKTIAIDREGNEYNASYSLGSFGGWMRVSGVIKGTQKDERRYWTGLRKDDRLVRFKLQSRPFWSSVIGNVSLKPNFRTGVQTEVEAAIARFQTAPSQAGADILVSLIDRQAVTGAQGRRILELLFRPKVTKREAYPLGQVPWVSVERRFLIDFDNMQLLREEDLWAHGEHQHGGSSAGGSYLAPTPRLINLHPVPKEPGTYEFEIRYKYGCTPDHKKVKAVYQCEFTVPVEVIVVEKEKAEKVTLVSDPKLDESMPRAFSVETPRLAGTYRTLSGKRAYTGGIAIHYKDIPHAAAFLRVFQFSDGREAEEVVNRLSTSIEQPIRLRANSSGTLWVGPQVFQLEQLGEYSGTLILRPSIEAAYKDPGIKSIWNGELTFPISFTVEAIEVETGGSKSDIGKAAQARSLEHFIGKYSRVRNPERPVIEITKKADVFIFHNLAGPSFEMEEAEDALKFADGGEQFLMRYDSAHETYYMDNLGIPGETRQVVSVQLIKLSARKPEDVFAATLPNSVTVELVGACEHPSEGRQWWGPDGAPIDKAPYYQTDRIKGRLLRSHGGRVDNYQFALRISGANEPHLDHHFSEVVPNDDYRLILDVGAQDANGRRTKNIRGIGANIEKGAKTAALRLSVAGGQWLTRAVCDTNSLPTVISSSGQAIALRLSVAGEQWLTRIDISGGLEGHQYRMIAVDHQGKKHARGKVGVHFDGGRLRRYTYSFDDLSMENIREFQLLSRPYRRVEFKNVSLRAGVRTDVEVEVEEGPGKSASEQEATQELYEGRTIEQWMKRWDRQEYDDIKEATETLVRIGRPAAPAMIRELKNRTNYGWHAVGVLAKMGPEAEDALAVLIEAALDKKLRFGDGRQSPSAYRGTVLYSLSNMTWARDRVVPLLQRIAEDGQEEDRMRASAVSALRNVGKEAMPILEKLTEAQERSVRDSAHGVLAHILEKEEGLSRKDYHARLVEKDPFDASAPAYLVSAKGIFNSGRPHPLTQRVKQLYRDRLAKEPDPQLAWQLATIIHNGLRNTELQWAAPAGGGKVRSTREDPAENFTTLAEALEMVFAHAEEDTELWFKSAIALAKLRLLQGDWDRMNTMLQALGKEPIPAESRPWLPAPPVDWDKELSQWTIADESMRSGNCSLEFTIEKDGTGLKGAHFLVKRAPEPTNVLSTHWRADTLFFAPHPLGDSRYSFGYMGNDRPMTRYAVSDKSGVVRFNKLPDFPVKIEVLVPTSNFEEVGSSWELWMEVVPGQFKIAKIYGGADAVGGGRPLPVERLREGRTVHYPRLVVRPAFGFNVADWDRVSKDFFMLTWQGLDAAQLDRGVHYELEMFLSAPDMPHRSVVHAPVVDSAKLTLKQNHWLVGQQGVGGLRLGPGNIYMFEVRAVDESGTVVARWPRTRVWVPWGYRQCDPPFASLPYRSPPDQYNSPPVYQGLYQGSWWKVDFEYEDGRKETLREKVTRFVSRYPNIFEYEYLRLRKAWIDWRDGDLKGAREQLEKLAKELPKGSVVRGTARHLLKQMDADEPHPKRLNFVPDYDAEDVKAPLAVDKAGVPVVPGGEKSVRKEEPVNWAGQMSLRLLVPKERVEGLRLVMFDRDRKKFVEAFAKSGPAMPGLEDKSCIWYEANCELPDVAMVENHSGKKYVLAGRRGVVLGRDSREGSGLVDAKAVITDGGNWAVEYELCSTAHGHLRGAAKQYAGHNMGVVIDGKMVSTFALEEDPGPRAVIRGNFTEEQAVALAEELKLGSPALRELLVKGIDAGDLGKVKKLLALNRNLLEASCFCTDSRGPLLEATLVSNIEIMRYLLEQGADVNAKVERVEGSDAGTTALHKAAEYGTSEMVELLVSYGANVNAIDAHGFTPLAMAASRAKPGPPVEPDNAIIEHLISSGADVNARGESGLSALTMAVMMQGYWKGQPHDERAKPRLESLKQTIELLLASGAQKDIFSAAGLGDTERVAAILEADPSTVNAQRAFGMAPLQMAAMGGHRETVRLLVEHGANVFTYDVSDSPFRYAALVGNLEMFKLLEQLREKYRDRMRAGRREIYYYREAMKSAIQQGHSQIVAHLVDQERDIRAELMEYGLSEAAEEGQVEVVRILLDRGGQVYASPALYKAAESVCDKPEPDVTMERYIAIAKLLIDSGADVNAKDRTGSTPLLRAARNLRSYEHKSVNTDFFELLIEKGADVNAACRELRGELALICAVRADNLELAAMLLEAGADPLAAKEISGRDRTVLEIARDDSSKDMVELLAKYAEPGYGELKKRFEGTMKQFVEAVTKKDDEALMLVTSARREYDRKQWPKRADKIRTDYEEHYELLQEIVGVGTARGFAALFIARPEGSEQRYSRLLLMEFPDGGWRVLQFHPTDDSPDDAFKEARNAYESLDSYQKAVFEAAGRLEEVAPKIPTGMSSQMPDQGSVTVSVRDGNLRFDFGDQPEGRYTAVEVLADRVKHWRSKNLLGVARKLKLEKGDLLLEAKDGKATLTAPGRKCVVDAHEGKVRMQSEGKVLMADEFTFELLGLKPAAK